MIIGLTAYGSADDRQACLVSGMDDVVTKSVSKATLLASLGKFETTSFDESVISVA